MALVEHEHFLMVSMAAVMLFSLLSPFPEMGMQLGGEFGACTSEEVSGEEENTWGGAKEAAEGMDFPCCSPSEFCRIGWWRRCSTAISSGIPTCSFQPVCPCGLGKYCPVEVEAGKRRGFLNVRAINYCFAKTPFQVHFRDFKSFLH